MAPFGMQLTFPKGEEVPTLRLFSALLVAPP